MNASNSQSETEGVICVQVPQIPGNHAVFETKQLRIFQISQSETKLSLVNCLIFCIPSVLQSEHNCPVWATFLSLHIMLSYLERVLYFGGAWVA